MKISTKDSKIKKKYVKDSENQNLKKNKENLKYI